MARYAPTRRIPAPRPPRGCSGGSDVAPQFRWTIETWVQETKHPWGSGEPRVSQRDKRVVAVVAPSEGAAKSKIIAALPPLPLDELAPHGCRLITYERGWSTSATVEEVTQ